MMDERTGSEGDGWGKAPAGQRTWDGQTDWSMIAAAANEGSAADAALARVLQRYWPAIFAYLRAAGLDVHDASDGTQGFVSDVLLGRRLLESADPRKGRFRALLRAALRNYLRDLRRRGRTRRRQPELAAVLSLDAVGPMPDDSDAARTPETAFTTQWSATMVRRVLEDVRRRCLADGHDRHWEVFAARVARPLLHGEEPAPYPMLVARFGLGSISQAANMVVTVKRRVAAAVREEIRATVEDAADANDELAELLRDLERH